MNCGICELEMETTLPSSQDQEVTKTEKNDDKMEMSEELTVEVENKEPPLIHEEEFRTQEKIISTQESLQPMCEDLLSPQEFESESASSTSETTSDKSNEQISTELSTNLQKIQLPERKRRRHRKRRKKKSNMLVNIVQEIIPVQKKVVCNNFTKCRSIHVRFDENGNPDKDIVSLRAPKIIKARIVKAFEVNLTVFDESKCELVDAEKTLEIEKSENFTEILKPRIIKAIEV